VFVNVILVSFFYIAYVMINQDIHDFENSFTDDGTIYKIKDLNVDGLNDEEKSVELKDCFLMGDVHEVVGAGVKMNFKKIECGELLVNEAFAYDAQYRHKGCM